MKLLPLIAASLLLAASPVLADDDYPGEIPALVEMAQQSGQKLVIVKGADVQQFNALLSAAESDDNAKAPEGTAYIVTVDALATSGAGEHEHADDPWPIVAFDKDGQKTGAGMFKRSIVEEVLKQFNGSPT